MYSRWLAANLDDPDLKPELESIQNDDAAIQDRFAVALKFGTAGLRGVIGAGTNRMNVYVVRQATQGLANWVKTQGGTQTVAISYDSRIKSDVFAKAAAEVLAANGVKVRIYSALMPVPALSFATRYYNCNAGIMVTASHNPAKYNGYTSFETNVSSGRKRTCPDRSGRRFQSRRNSACLKMWIRTYFVRRKSFAYGNGGIGRLPYDTCVESVITNNDRKRKMPSRPVVRC